MIEKITTHDMKVWYASATGRTDLHVPHGSVECSQCGHQYPLGQRHPCKVPCE